VKRGKVGNVSKKRDNKKSKCPELHGSDKDWIKREEEFKEGESYRLRCGNPRHPGEKLPFTRKNGKRLTQKMQNAIE